MRIQSMFWFAALILLVSQAGALGADAPADVLEETALLRSELKDAENRFRHLQVTLRVLPIFGVSPQ